MKDAINKKWNIDSGPNDKNIPQMYVQDVENNVPKKIVSQENKIVNTSDETKYLLKSLSDDAVEVYRKVSEIEGRNGVDSGTALRNFNRFYLGGLRGESFLKLSTRYGDNISYQSKKLAYEQGLAEAKKNEKSRATDSKKAKVYEGGIENREALQGVEGIDKKQVDLIDRVSKMLGVKVRILDVVKNAKGKEVNAKVSDGVIAISKKAVMGEDSKGGALRFLFNHEITHRISELAPKQYRKFCDIALEYASLKTGLSVNELIDRYSNERGSNGEDLNVFELMDEIASDVAGMDIFSSDLIEYAARENIGVFEKMKNLLFDVLDKLGIAKYSEVDKLKRTWQKAFDKAKKQAEINSRNVDLQEDSGVERYSVDKSFASSYDSWVNSGRPDRKVIKVGYTSEALKSIGVKEQKITWDTSKMNKLLKKHVYLDDIILKQVPQLIEDPILVMQSKQSNSRIIICGELYDKDGLPIMAVLELLPLKDKTSGIILDEIKIASTHSRKNKSKVSDMSQTQNMINTNDILYIEPDKKRTNKWLMRTRLQLPFGITKYGSIKSVTYPETIVKTKSQNSSGEIDPFGKIAKDLEVLNKAYGTIEKGEKPMRDVNIPKQISDDRYTQRFARTVIESDKITDKQAESILEAVRDGVYTYSKISDEKAWNAAKKRYEEWGHKDCLEQWDIDLRFWNFYIISLHFSCFVI